MKLLLTIDWSDYYFEGTAAEAATLNSVLSRCVKTVGNVDSYGGKGQKATLSEDSLRHSMRFLNDNCVVTAFDPIPAE